MHIRRRARRGLSLALSLLLVAFAPGAVAKPGNGNGPGKHGEDGGGEPSQFLAFSSSQTEVAAGTSVVLSWASTGTRHCFASGDWDGRFASDGFYSTPPLDSAKTYHLECKNGSRAVAGTVTVALTTPADPDPAPEPEPEPEPEPAPEPEPTPEPEPEPVPEPTPAPQVSLSAGAVSVPFGASTRLTWSSSHASACSAGGGWSGSMPLSGDASTGLLQQTTTYRLTCTGEGGSTSASVTVTVEPAPAPSVELRAASNLVDSGDAAQLTWSSANADGCSASGAWSGPRPISGVETTVVLTERTTFALNCTGPGGTAMAMLSVSVNGTVALEWQPPAENVDGTPLNDLGGFRIYYGTSSGAYTDSLQIDVPSLNSHALALPSGDYYFAMTAVDADGNESGYSNEVVKTVD